MMSPRCESGARIWDPMTTCCLTCSNSSGVNAPCLFLTDSRVLNKQGSLTPDEFEHVKQHVVIGSQILAPLSHLGDIIPAVRHHHERWDGTGYPDGLRGEEIPIGARIIGAAEVFDALSTSRAYQEKMSPEKAVERAADLSGT